MSTYLVIFSVVEGHCGRCSSLHTLKSLIRNLRVLDKLYQKLKKGGHWGPMVQENTEEQKTKDKSISLVDKEVLFYGEQLSSLENEVSFYVERGKFYK